MPLVLVMHRRFGPNRIELIEGDIAAQVADAIVNAANSALAGGGGVDGAIHQAAGPSLMDETRRRYPDGCPTGGAVATRAGNLPAKYVFHAVGPIWRGGEAGEEALLRSAVEACLDLAVAYRVETLALPALSTGAYGYPLDLAARAILQTLAARLPIAEFPKTVRLVLHGSGAVGQFSRVLESLPEGESPTKRATANGS